MGHNVTLGAQPSAVSEAGRVTLNQNNDYSNSLLKYIASESQVIVLLYISVWIGLMKEISLWKIQ